MDEGLFVGHNVVSGGDVTVVDVRDPYGYEEGHIPGAVNVPFKEFRDPTNETEGKLPTKEGFSSLLGNTGISSDDDVVAYDDGFGLYASRFVVTAEVFGHPLDSLGVLDGDYTAWKRGGRVEEGDAQVGSGDVVYEAERTDGPLISADELEGALDEATIIDTRDGVEYRTVHLPGAVNVKPHELVDEETRCLKPVEERAELLKEHGVDFDKPVRLYCNTARRLSFVYLVLVDMGHSDVVFYEEGIKGWANEGRPVETS